MSRLPDDVAGVDQALAALVRYRHEFPEHATFAAERLRARADELLDWRLELAAEGRTSC